MNVVIVPGSMFAQYVCHTLHPSLRIGSMSDTAEACDWARSLALLQQMRQKALEPDQARAVELLDGVAFAGWNGVLKRSSMIVYVWFVF